MGGWSSEAQKGGVSPEVPAFSNQPIPYFHNEPKGRISLGSKQH